MESIPLPRAPSDLPNDYPQRIKELRKSLGLSQERFAEKIGVAFATVNRWENGQSKPSTLTWKLIIDLGAKTGSSLPSEPTREISPTGPQRIDFFADPNAVKAIVEGHRLSHGYLSNPTFATESSMVDPLPHQRMAVYGNMLGKSRLRFLLADDAGAGKTIMTGLYIKEMLSRRLVNRVLVVPPAGLLGNWRSEMQKLFGLEFRIIRGSDAQGDNPFIGEDSDLVIVSMDTLSGEKMFSRLKEDIAPYDIVIFDEAHKLSADLNLDKSTIHKTDRYRLAEALAGAPDLDARWALPWCANHLLLLTATPHMGKDTPYYYLWKLLEPSILLTKEAFDIYPEAQRREHFIRRTKEEMVRFDGTKIYPARECHTAGYSLTEGSGSERELYEATTHYIEEIYNSAGILNKSAASLAGSVFQRRMTSSTYALKCSFERRALRLQGFIDRLSSGEVDEEKLRAQQKKIKARDDFEEATGDDESSDGEREQNERDEDDVLSAMIHFNIEQLKLEKAEVEKLQQMAQIVLAQGMESKFARLQELLTDERLRDEKVIIFTEHRDTLVHLQQELEKRGLTGRIASIHGGMDFTQREEQIKFFKKDHTADGAQYLIATDAAGEGINLQFCWIMVNYDIPWNPARLEQRMGRIHRYGQKHDPVVIMNMVSTNTREGMVMQTLLEKMEKIRKEMGSDKVFDVIGRLFEGVSIRDIMARALKDEEGAEKDIQGRLTEDQVRAIKAKEEALYGSGGDVEKHLPKEREKLSKEEYRYLLPAYVSNFLELALPLLDIGWEGDIRGAFTLFPKKARALDRISPLLEAYPEEVRGAMSANRADGNRAIFLRPGEIVFDRICDLLEERCAALALKGGLFIDPGAKEPYYYHVAKLNVVRKADNEFPGLSRGVIVEERLVAVIQDPTGTMSLAPMEKLLLLRGAGSHDMKALDMMTKGEALAGKVPTFLAQTVAADMLRTCHERISLVNHAKEEFLLKGFNLKEAELARIRTKLGLKRGDLDASQEMERVKAQQRGLDAQKQAAKRVLERELGLLEAGSVQMITHAVAMPSMDPEDIERYDKDIEAMAMKVVMSIEESDGSMVLDVHKPELARKAGLQDYPGFDILSKRVDGSERGIEVKGRAGGGAVEITENEWGRAANLRHKYWLYAVFDCDSGAPRLVKVQDPAFRLSFSQKGSFVVNEGELLRVAGKKGDEC